MSISKAKYIVPSLIILLLTSLSLSASQIPTKEDILSIVPGGKSYEREIDPIDKYVVRDQNGNVLANVLLTSKVPPEVIGYGGEIDVLVGVDTNGKIIGTKVIGYSETENFVQRVIASGFLKNFLGKKHGDDFGEIEAVTGATITSSAIVDDIKGTLETIAKQDIGKKGKVENFIYKHLVGVEVAAVILLLILSVTAVYIPRKKYLRHLTLVGALLIVGVWLNTPITIGSLVDVRNLGFAQSSRLLLSILIIYAVASSVLKGNLYCSYICPFGALQTGLSSIKVPKVCPSREVDKTFRLLRWIVAFAAVYMIAAKGSIAFRLIEPFASMFSFVGDTTIIVQTTVVLIASIFISKIWCRYFCPTGFVLDLFAMLGAKVKFKLRNLRRKN